jgi:D-alanyl-D-alanine carboxypeptidase/D-alanyl-D-alanine-endopeptidase (penicillin-binding protein 4)
MLKTIGVGRPKPDGKIGSWPGTSSAGLIQLDGSGLSRYNYITPETMTAVLLHVERSERLRGVYESTLPIAGRDGTLEQRMRGTAAEGRASVKTGSMNNVRSAAGYARTADNRLVAFTIIANNFDNTSAVINAATDEIIARIATYRER